LTLAFTFEKYGYKKEGNGRYQRNLYYIPEVSWGGGEMKVLIVDDSSLTRAILHDYLKDEGFEVFEASSPDEARRLFKELHPGLVIKDLFMGDWDLIESVQYFKELDENVKILLCSTDASQREIVEALRAGANDFILKPLSKIQVLATVHRAAGV
jgi:DNA-binding response OmpR family regulator